MRAHHGAADMRHCESGSGSVKMKEHLVLMSYSSHDLRWSVCDAISVDPEIMVMWALDYPGIEHTNSCRLCDTDYSVTLEDEKTLKFQAWHDLGTQGFPSDETWRRQVSGSMKCFPHPHCHGSYARDLSNSAEPKPAKKRWRKRFQKRSKN